MLLGKPYGSFIFKLRAYESSVSELASSRCCAGKITLKVAYSLRYFAVDLFMCVDHDSLGVELVQS